MKKETQPKPFCFVLMPFSESFDDIYAFGIKGACDDAGVYCERVDEQIFEGTVLDRIYNQISKADVIVADMTGMNPNVFYEVGYAHALGRRTILLTEKAEDIPFDLKHFPHIVYNNKIKDLRKSLSKHIKKFAFHSTSQKQYELGLELYWENYPLSERIVAATVKDMNSPSVNLTLHNASTITYQPNDFSIGLCTYAKIAYTFTPEPNRSIRSQLPAGKYLHLFSLQQTIFPDVYFPFSFRLNEFVTRPLVQYIIEIKIFSAAGSRDFLLGLTPDIEIE